MRRQKQLDGCLRVYVPMVHGIGVPSAAHWAGRSTTLLADWLAASGKPWTAHRDCWPGCPNSEHHHLRLDTAGRPLEVLLDPVCWAEAAPPIGRWRLALWTVRATLQVCVLYLLAGWIRRLRRIGFDRVSSRVTFFGWRWLVGAADVISFAVLTAAVASAAPPLALLAALATAFIPKVRLMTSHAMTWTYDYTSREQIMEWVRKRCAVEADHRVLVGHSQGGSILTTLINDQRLDSEATLITLGTGQGLLEVLNHTRARGTAAALGSLFFLFVLSWSVLIAADPVVVLAERSTAQLVSDAAGIGAAIWSLDLSSSLSSQLSRHGVEQVMQWEYSWLSSSTPMPSLEVLSCAWTASAGLLTALYRFREVPGRVIQAAKPNVTGVDVVASHDPVAGIMAALRDAPRVQIVPSRASLILDHVRYFQNGPFVLAPIEAAFDALAIGDETAIKECFTPEILADGVTTLNRGRVLRAVSVVVGFGVFSACGQALGTTAASAMAPVGALIGYLAATLEIAAQSARSNVEQLLPAGQRWRLRRQRLACASLMTTWIPVAAAIPMIGAAAALHLLPVPMPMPNRVLATMYQLETWGGVASLLLLAGASASRLHSRLGTRAVVLGYVLSAAVWVSQGTVLGFAAGGLMAVLAYRTGSKRRPPWRGLSGVSGV